MKEMGKRIHDKRKECGLSMEELAEKIGVNKSSISKWESGTVGDIKRIYIAKMAQIFHVKPSWLMGYDQEEGITLTYEAPGQEAVKLSVDHEPIIGATSKIAELYGLILSIDPKNYDLAIRILKSLSQEENK
jgi:transcriptional regulator with XRE-family HTH domain